MFDNIIKFFKKFSKEDKKDSKETAKERLHLVLMQDRANVSADFMELMKQEIIEVIKKYIDVDENSIDVKLTNKVNNDGTTGAPILYANIPILNVKDDTKQINIERNLDKKESTSEQEKVVEENKEEVEKVKDEETSIEKTEETQDVEKQEEIIEENVTDKEENKEEQVEEVVVEEVVVEENKEEDQNSEQAEVK